MSYILTADIVVSMAGYNTVCEILSAAKPALIIPRVQPSQEQLLRAEIMNHLGLFSVIYPRYMTPKLLMNSLLNLLYIDKITPSIQLDMNALPRISHYIQRLLSLKITESNFTYLEHKKIKKSCS